MPAVGDGGEQSFRRRRREAFAVAFDETRRRIEPVDAAVEIHRPDAAARIDAQSLRTARAQTVAVARIVAEHAEVAPQQRQLHEAAVVAADPQIAFVIEQNIRNEIAGDAARQRLAGEETGEISGLVAMIESVLRADPQTAVAIAREAEHGFMREFVADDEFRLQLRVDDDQTAVGRREHRAVVALHQLAYVEATLVGSHSR